MQLCIEGYRSHNKELYQALGSAALWYCGELLGTRMANNIYLDIKLTNNLKKK